jgi:hypothetical protein
MNEIETYKTFTLKGNLYQTTDFCYDINIEFVPDEIVLKYLTAYDEDTATKESILTIMTDLIDGHIIASIPKATAFHESYNIPFNNNKRPIQGCYNFSFRAIDGSNPVNSATFDMDIAMTLVFIKWKKK